MKNTIVLGLLRGDEGKGKIVDYLSDEHDIIIRFQGGPNAGHTIYRDDIKCVLHQIPSGILNKKICVIGHGCLIDPKKLMNEIEMLCNTFQFDLDYIKEHLKVARGCHVIFPEHIKQDTKRENAGKGNGSTKCGISPAYRDKYYREGSRMTDLFKISGENYKEICKTFELTEAEYYFIEQLLIDDTYYLNYECEDKNLLFEGAQGVFLDIDSPVYPNVSSSHVNVGGVIAGTGISYKRLNQNLHIVGIAKGYMSSVGVGNFLTEIKDQKDAEYLRKINNEYGATTGRPRKIGYLDLPMIKHAVDTIGVTELCLTRLDTVYDMFKLRKEFPVCVDYAKIIADEILIDDKLSWFDLDEYKPVYKKFDLWEKCSLSDKNFQKFIKYIEDYLEIPVKYISCGKEKTDLIVTDRLNGELI